MAEQPIDDRELDHGNVLETKDHGTFVVVGVQRVEDADGNVQQFNYLITRPSNLISEEETEGTEEE